MKGFFIAMVYAGLFWINNLYAEKEESSLYVVVGADYTFWTAKEDGLMTAVGNILSVPMGPNIPRTDIIYPRWRVRSGYKLFVGMGSKTDRSEFLVRYTYFHNHNNPLVPVEFPNGQYPSYFGSIPAAALFRDDRDQIKSLSSSWNDILDRIDIRFSKAFGNPKTFLFSPFMGLIIARHEQWFSMTYIPVNIIDSVDIHINARQWFWCYGPSCGVDMELLFFQSPIFRWGIFLEKGLSIAWFNPIATVQTTRDDPDAVWAQNTRNVFYSMFPILEMSLGFRWSIGEEETPNFILQIGWELSAWFDQNHMFSNFVFRGSGVCNALYTLQGLTVKGAFIF